jgi:GTP:adenosylcobinamide-phosphate guanylyltransferase
MGEWTAILLAGERSGEDGFARSRGVAAKALIPIAGEPMLARVARALLAAPSVGRVVVLAQAPDALLAQAPAWLREEPRLVTAVSGDGIAASVAAIAGTDQAPYPLLLTTADHALLSPEMVETFLAGAAGADVAFAMVERRTVEAAWPETRRTWIKARGGQYSGANLFALASPKAERALAFWAGVERDRKKVLRLLAFLGPLILLRALTRTITLDGAVAKLGRRLGLTARAIVLPFAEAAIDVDKPEDLELVERILAERQPG